MYLCLRLLVIVLELEHTREVGVRELEIAAHLVHLDAVHVALLARAMGAMGRSGDRAMAGRAVGTPVAARERKGTKMGN